MVHHGADRAYGQPVADGLAHIDDEHGKSLGAASPPGRAGWCGASRIIRSEYSARLVQIFLAVDDVAIALAPGEGLERGGIRARTRLRHAEGLEPQLAARHIGEVGLLLRFRTVAQDRAHDIHLRMAGSPIAARALDLLEDRRRRRERQAGAAVFLGDQRGEVAGLRERIDEFRRIGVVAVELAPVFARKIGAQTDYRLADVLMAVDHARLSHHILLTLCASARAGACHPGPGLSCRRAGCA